MSPSSPKAAKAYCEEPDQVAWPLWFLIPFWSGVALMGLVPLFIYWWLYR